VAETWISELGRIDFSKVGGYLGACDVLALPLLKSIANVGRWPSKINDYFAAGRPVVTTRVGEIARYEQCNVGVFAEPDAAAFADAVLFLAGNPEQANRLGSGGRRVAESILDWSKLTLDLERFYLTVRKEARQVFANQRIEDSGSGD